MEKDERAALFAELLARGLVEICPLCLGCGHVSPEKAVRARGAIPVVDPDRPTEPDLRVARPKPPKARR